MEPMEHLSMQHVHQAELAHWAGHVHQERHRLASRRPTPSATTGAARRAGLASRVRNLFTGRPVGRRA
jgi:hypothetical protein